MNFFLWAAALEALVDTGLAAIVALTVRRPVFWLIQFVSWHLMVLGWLVCLWPRLARASQIFWNDDDPPVGRSWWGAYVWLAWRNPVDNLKHARWTQRAGGPLAYKTWLWRGRQFYYKVGWMSDGYAAMSIGGGRGY